MTIILKRGQRLADALPKSVQNAGTKKLDAMKHVGVLTHVEDALTIQRRLRDEWK